MEVKITIKGIQFLSQNRFLLRLREWDDVDYIFSVIAFFSGRSNHNKLFDLSSSFEELSDIMTKIALNSGSKKYSSSHSNYIADIRKATLTEEAAKREFEFDNNFISIIGLALMANKNIYIYKKNLSRFVAGLIFNNDSEFVKSCTEDISMLED